MAAPGYKIGGSIWDTPQTQDPLTQFGNPNSFTAAAQTQAKDYDTIMKEYGDLANSYQSNPLSATPVTTSSIAPQTTPYTQSGDVTKSLGDLSNLADTGGYSAADIADIRARDISPIRSIYADSQRQLNQSRALGGGYSPNFNAVLGQMSRDEANKISDVTTAANAGIAQNVASNKIAAAGSYGSASSAEASRKTAADQHNSDIINQINQANVDRSTQVGEFNSATSLDAQKTNRMGALGAVQGQASLYGTTPALTQTFGNQVGQAASIGQSQQDINNRRFATLANTRSAWS